MQRVREAGQKRRTYTHTHRHKAQTRALTPYLANMPVNSELGNMLANSRSCGVEQRGHTTHRSNNNKESKKLASMRACVCVRFSLSLSVSLSLSLSFSLSLSLTAMSKDVVDSAKMLEDAKVLLRSMVGSFVALSFDVNACPIPIQSTPTLTLTHTHSHTLLPTRKP